MSQKAAVKFIQHGEESSSELEEVFVHFSPTKNIWAKANSLLDFLIVLSRSSAPPQETIINNKVDDLVLLMELSLWGPEKKRSDLIIGFLFK